ncbi:MAG: DUF1232 domain-containing protein [Bacteroidales bacterium]|nr:DUF1232 domain-containing protein [Bacteroidales bacterium]
MENSNLTPEELTKYQKHFSESDFWLKLSTLAQKAGVKLTYYALTLYYTLTDPNTPTTSKAVIAGALGYMILPLDLVPDFLPFAGLADDWAALIAAVTYVTSAITPAIKARAREKTEEWFGPLADSQLDGLE